MNPRRDRMKPFYKKTPLQQPTRKERELKLLANIGSRKHAVFFGPLFFPRLLQQRAGLKVTSPIHHHK